MKHLGDITKISGYDVPVVDVVCGGSPCQDLSIAGKRAGLDGERSGLFMEQVRIVKEMREKDEEGQRDRRTDKHIRPRFMVWENVPGAFTSPGKRNGEEHRGEDFQAVLTEIARIAKSNCPDVPLPKDRRWPHSGCIVGIGDNGQPFSIAYRLHDAQFWGVPQRRKRIALVADFGGCAAPNILFEKVSAVEQGLPRNIEQSEQTWKGTTKDTERSTRETSKTYDVRISSDGTKNWRAHCYETDICRSLDTGGEDPNSNHGGVTVVQGFPLGFRAENTRMYDEKATTLCSGTRPGFTCGVVQVAKTYSIDQGGGKSACNVLEEQSPTLTTTHDGAPAVYNISPYKSNAMKSSNPHSGIYEARTSRTLDLNSGNPNCNQGGTMILENHPNDSRVKIKEDNIVQTLSSRMGTGGGNVPMVMEYSPIYSIGHDLRTSKFTDDEITDPLTASDYKDPQCVVYANEAYDKWSESEKGATLRACGGIYNGSSENLSVNYTVRRLTPLECERLQGFPDRWTDIGEWIDSKGKKHKDADSPRYKALGNSIALPFWQWMADRMVKVLKEDGVQLPTMASLFDGIGGFPLVYSRCGCKPIWASEIEEFPMAVTKIRFPEVDYEGGSNNKRE